MTTSQLLEGLGYLASVLVAVSLMMRSILRLRIINLIGAVCFTVYGALIAAYPVAMVNFIIALINIYFLFQMTRAREQFALAEVRPVSDYLRQFLKFYASEIARFQPEFTHDPIRPQNVYFILRDMVPAGLIITEPREAGSAWITLDFVTPAYRDLRVADFLFRQNTRVFLSRGIATLYSAPGNAPHEAYLRRLGFVPANGAYRYDLTS
ncbi:MAG: hypothetical protein ACT4QE_03895 [Anaerolineales bacterium]